MNLITQKLIQWILGNFAGLLISVCTLMKSIVRWPRWTSHPSLRGVEISAISKITYFVDTLLVVWLKMADLQPFSDWLIYIFHYFTCKFFNFFTLWDIHDLPKFAAVTNFKRCRLKDSHSKLPNEGFKTWGHLLFSNLQYNVQYDYEPGSVAYKIHVLQ